MGRHDMGFGSWGAWSGGWGEPGPGRHGRHGFGAHPGPPPWLAGLFGMGRPEPGRGPRVRRGDVRSAILDVLREANQREESPNGYQVIQAITERSGGAWRPSPGSVYPTVQQLQDEGLVEVDEGRGRRALRLTPAGASWCAEHAAELDAVWAPFDRRRDAAAGSGGAGGGWQGGQAEQGGQGGDVRGGDLKAEIGQVMSAVWQIVTAGSDDQRRAAVGVLVDARRSLYGILADGPNPGPGPGDSHEPDESDEPDGPDGPDGPEVRPDRG